MKKALRDVLPFAKAFARLLHPFAEVVVHDLKKDRIEAIFNPFSRREVGDDSYLDRVEFSETDEVIGPYDKTNWDGRPLKSISVVVREKTGQAVGFLCVNLDVSAFKTYHTILQAFLDNAPALSVETQRLFKEDLYEKVNLYIQAYCRENHVSVEALSREEKKKLVGLLAKEGAFNEKNAAAYIGRVLGISRATVYSYLKGVKES